MTRDEHLLIDGHNVIHCLPQFSKALRTSLVAGQEKLAQVARILHDFDGVRTTIVFDGKGEAITIDRPTPELTFSCLFSPTGTTADAIIEQLVAHSSKPDNITVVSRDQMVCQTVCALGAHCITPDDFMQRIAFCEQRQTEHIKRHNREIKAQWKKD